MTVREMTPTDYRVLHLVPASRRNWDPDDWDRWFESVTGYPVKGSYIALVRLGVDILDVVRYARNDEGSWYIDPASGCAATFTDTFPVATPPPFWHPWKPAPA